MVAAGRSRLRGHSIVYADPEVVGAHGPAGHDPQARNGGLYTSRHVAGIRRQPKLLLVTL